MSKVIKAMLVWVIIFPILATTFLIVIDYFKGVSIEVTSYFSNLIGFVVGGIFIGVVMYYVQKLKEDN